MLDKLIKEVKDSTLSDIEKDRVISMLKIVNHTAWWEAKDDAGVMDYDTQEWYDSQVEQFEKELPLKKGK